MERPRSHAYNDRRPPAPGRVVGPAPKDGEQAAPNYLATPGITEVDDRSLESDVRSCLPHGNGDGDGGD
jgi:hypothetical protein